MVLGDDAEQAEGVTAPTLELAIPFQTADKTLC